MFQVNRVNVERNVIAWLYVPIGITIILLMCFAVDSLIALSKISFPASMAVLIILFGALLLCEIILGGTRTRQIVNVIEVPVCILTIRKSIPMVLTGVVDWLGLEVDQRVLHSFFRGLTTESGHRWGRSW